MKIGDYTCTQYHQAMNLIYDCEIKAEVYIFYFFRDISSINGQSFGVYLLTNFVFLDFRIYSWEIFCNGKLIGSNQLKLTISINTTFVSICAIQTLFSWHKLSSSLFVGIFLIDFGIITAIIGPKLWH